MHSSGKSSGGLVTTKAIVISSLKFGEADLIVHCFTQSDGLRSYLLKNILKSKKGKLRTAMFQPLSQLEIVARHKSKNSLDYLREAKVYFPYKSLQTNIFKASIALFLGEVLRNVIQEEETNPALFLFLEESFQFLDQAEDHRNFHHLFLLQLTRFLGFYPRFSEAPFFNLLEGVFQQEENGKYVQSSLHSSLLKKSMQLTYENSAQLASQRETRNDFLKVILLYYQLHVQGFRQPKSLEVLQQLFA